MVATLVIALPSTYEGGALLVRHRGAQRRLLAGGGPGAATSCSFAAFYAGAPGDGFAEVLVGAGGAAALEGRTEERPGSLRRRSQATASCQRCALPACCPPAQTASTRCRR